MTKRQNIKIGIFLRVIYTIDNFLRLILVFSDSFKKKALNIAKMMIELFDYYWFLHFFYDKLYSV